MFQRIGKIVSSGWWAFLLAWGIVLGVLTWKAPRWRDVILEGEFAFLPESLPSRRGEELFKKAFPRQYFPSNVFIVLSRRDGEISAQDQDFIKQHLHPGPEEIIKKDREAAKGKNKPIIGAFHSPRRKAPAICY
jgi:hypothetical protein